MTGTKDVVDAVEGELVFTGRAGLEGRGMIEA
jgi:hypothetical protein